MIKIDIPGFGLLQLQHLVCDFSGTLSVDGDLVDGVAAKLSILSKDLELHVLTADTHGKARESLKDIKCKLEILEPKYQDFQKEKYILTLGAHQVVAIGNGTNDKLMLKTSKLGIAVCLAEGVAFDAARSANIMVWSILDALDLLLYPKRLIGTLRF